MKTLSIIKLTDGDLPHPAVRPAKISDFNLHKDFEVNWSGWHRMIEFADLIYYEGSMGRHVFKKRKDLQETFANINISV